MAPGPVSARSASPPDRICPNSPMKNSTSYAPLLARPFLVEEIDRKLASRRLREFVRQGWR